eukprot:m.161996 g.161996  ORF g.161996 m.161996 type:complete len:941 (-) comp17660_c0_seq4:47-2869(-)
MGGCQSKTSHEADNRIAGEGMGCVARAYREVASTRRVSVMTGSWEVAREDIDPDHHNVLGECAFGQVYESSAQLPLDGGGRGAVSAVIIKKLSSQSEKLVTQGFYTEIQLLKEISHKNVLKLVGVVTQDTPLLMLFSRPSNGNLKSFLRRRQQGELLTNAQRMGLARDLAAGMAYLASLKIVHKDLAARNCHVTENIEGLVGDFGLGQYNFPNDYGKIGGFGPLPLRWLAPETLRHKTKSAYSKATDVWSFGVLMWEIASYANQPYPKLTMGEVENWIVEGKGLEEPKGTPANMFDAISACTRVAPEKRPTFEELVQMLSALVSESATGVGAHEGGEMYVEMNTAEQDPRLVRLAQATTEGSFQRLIAEEDTGKTTLEEQGKAMSKVLKRESGAPSAVRSSFRSLSYYAEKDDPSQELLEIKKREVQEWPRSSVTVLENLGKGAFGVVAKGKLADGRMAALKTLKAGSTEEDRDALLAEAYLVSQFDHQNVVACFGQVTVGEPAMIIFEFMENGSLYTYLRNLEASPDLRTKLRMAIDIARGMSYLANLNHVHRDLATRNVLVSEKLVCKISDFGLSRDLQDEMYYESEGGMIPIRWTPPEAYKYKKYSTKSDVWSFGILMMELWTKAALPYGRDWSNLMVMMEVERGFRLPAPSDCPRAIYSLMMDCWHPRRASRPEFSSIAERVEMAYDMLFPADGGDSKVKDEYIEVSQADRQSSELIELQQLYMGVPVPTLETMDDEAYLMPQALPEPEIGSPLDSANTSANTSMAASPQKHADSVARELEMIATRGEGVVARKSMSQSVIDDLATATKIELPKLNPVATLPTRNRGSLRKQREKGEDEEAGASNAGGVEYVNSKRVADVLKIAAQRNKISELEERGIHRVMREGQATENDAQEATKVQSTYIETVGRAVETPAARIAGRKVCRCRRFKCVCNFDD